VDSHSLAGRALVAAALTICALALTAAPTASEAPVAASAQERHGGPPARVQVERSVRYGDSYATALDVYRTPARRRAPAVLVVHGGGWRFGDKRRMEGISSALAQAGFVAFNVNYTLAAWWRPGFPRQLRELRAAVRWVRRNAARFGVDPARIGALGSSAGAHLVGLLGVHARGPLDAGARVAAVSTWSAPFDLTRTGDPGLASAVETFLGCAGPCESRRAAASPTAHVSPDDPPMLLLSSEHELVPLAHSELMAARLAAAGVPHRLWVIPGSAHGTDYTAIALAPSIEFLGRRLGRTGVGGRSRSQPR